MSWIDDDDYVGPDRRNGRSFRILERRRHDSAQAAPSLALLLRKLQIWASEMIGSNPATIGRYRARLQVVAKLAGERGESDVETWLSALDRSLESAQRQGGHDLAEICNRHLQSAMAVLNEGAVTA